jgi:hypothetical protein
VDAEDVPQDRVGVLQRCVVPDPLAEVLVVGHAGVGRHDHPPLPAYLGTVVRIVEADRMRNVVRVTPGVAQRRVGLRVSHHRRTTSRRGKALVMARNPDTLTSVCHRAMRRLTRRSVWPTLAGTRKRSARSTKPPPSAGSSPPGGSMPTATSGSCQARPLTGPNGVLPRPPRPGDTLVVARLDRPPCFTADPMQMVGTLRDTVSASRAFTGTRHRGPAVGWSSTCSSSWRSLSAN